MSPGVVKQSSTSSCCSALSWTGSESSQHSQTLATPTHSGSLPYLPPPSYEKAIQESHEAALLRAQESEDRDDREDGVVVGLEHRDNREDREDGYETLRDVRDVQMVDIPIQGPKQGPIVLHKSSKALYRAVAAQWGITCKMNDHCRCLDCQSRYFDCDYDSNEDCKTDGGLGATSPIFLQEVVHGTACNIL